MKEKIGVTREQQIEATREKNDTEKENKDATKGKKAKNESLVKENKNTE